MSDHNNLKYFMSTKVLSGKQARWAEELAKYDFEIEYKPGVNNPADAPSRRPDYKKGFVLGVGQRVREAMIPTLQQKLRIWSIRMTRAQSAKRREAELNAQGEDLPGVEPEGLRRHPETTPSALDIRGTSPSGDASPSGSRTSSTSQEDSRETDPLEAMREPLSNLSDEMSAEQCAEALIVEAPRMGAASSYIQARRAASGDSAFVSETPSLLLDHIRKAQERDRAHLGFAALARRGGDGAKKGEPSWSADSSGVLRRAGKVWIPDDVALREAILTRNHDDPVGGHYGVARTTEVLQRKYFWNRLREDVKKYVRHCA